MAVYRADYNKVFIDRYNKAMEEVMYRSTQSNWMDLEDIGNRIKAMLSYRQDNADKITSEYGRKLAQADLRFVRQLYQGWVNLHVLRLQAQPNPYTTKDIYLGEFETGGLSDFRLGISAMRLYNKLYNKNLKYPEDINNFRVIQSQLYHGYFMFIDQQDRDIMIELEKQEFKARQQGSTGLLGFESQDADLGFFQAVQYTGVAVLFGYVGYAAISGAGAAAASESVGAAAASNTAAASTATVTTATSAGAAGGAATESGALLGQAGILSGASAPVAETTLSLGSVATAVGSGSSTGALSTFLASTGSAVLTSAESAVGASIVNQVKNAINPKKTPESVTSAPVQAMPVTPVTNPVSSLPTNQILIAVAGAVGLALLLFI